MSWVEAAEAQTASLDRLAFREIDHVDHVHQLPQLLDAKIELRLVANADL